MARNRTLLAVLDMFRAESRMSMNPAHNQQVRDQHVALLRRTQERLWEETDWAALKVTRDIPLQAGERYYAPPEDIQIDRVATILVRREQRWIPLDKGIAEQHYALHDSDTGQRAWPARRWRIAENPSTGAVEQIEVWPVPDSNADSVSLEGMLRVCGTRNLRRFVDDADRADLDDRLIALFAAAEVLAASGAKDAQMKLDAAKRLLLVLRGNQENPASFRLFGGGRSDSSRPPRPIAVYNRPPS